MHVVADGRLVKTLPSPIEPRDRAKLIGARKVTTPLPPPPAQPLPAIPPTASPWSPANAGASPGQTVSIATEDTVFHVLLGDVELSTHDRRTDKAVTRFKADSRTSTRG